MASRTINIPATTNLDADELTSGTVPFARLSTGSGSTQVAVGDHTHTAAVGDRRRERAAVVVEDTRARRRAATRDRRLVRRFHPLGVHAFLLAVLIVEIDIAVKVWTAALHVLGH